MRRQDGLIDIADKAEMTGAIGSFEADPISENMTLTRRRLRCRGRQEGIPSLAQIIGQLGDIRS
jgi:hypothetical protein